LYKSNKAFTHYRYNPTKGYYWDFNQSRILFIFKIEKLKTKNLLNNFYFSYKKKTKTKRRKTPPKIGPLFFRETASICYCKSFLIDFLPLKVNKSLKRRPPPTTTTPIKSKKIQWVRRVFKMAKISRSKRRWNLTIAKTVKRIRQN